MKMQLASEGVHYLSAGDFYCEVSHVSIRTTLGSCVAVCAWNNKSKRSAMVHYLLPYKSNKYTCKSDDYFGDKVLSKLIYALKKYAALSDYKFYAYGGGSFMERGITADRIGVQNILFLQKWAKTHNIEFTQSSLGGEYCRIVTLNGATGEVVLRETM